MGCNLRFWWVESPGWMSEWLFLKFVIPKIVYLFYWGNHHPAGPDDRQTDGQLPDPSMLQMPLRPFCEGLYGRSPYAKTGWQYQTLFSINIEQFLKLKLGGLKMVESNKLSRKLYFYWQNHWIVPLSYKTYSTASQLDTSLVAKTAFTGKTTK